MKTPIPVSQSIVQFSALIGITTLLIYLNHHNHLTLPTALLITIVIIFVTILSVLVYEIVFYYQHKQSYLKSQYYNTYNYPFNLVIKNPEHYHQVLINQLLLKQFSDHAELLNHLVIKTSPCVPIDLIFMHQTGLYACQTNISYSTKLFKQCTKHLSDKIKVPIACIKLEDDKAVERFIKTLKNKKKVYQQSTIHHYYDIILTHTLEQTYQAKKPNKHLT